MYIIISGSLYFPELFSTRFRNLRDLCLVPPLQYLSHFPVPVFCVVSYRTGKRGISWGASMCNIPKEKKIKDGCVCLCTCFVCVPQMSKLLLCLNCVWSNMLELSAPWIMHMDARKLLAWLYFPIKQKVKLFKNELSLKIGGESNVTDTYEQEYVIMCEICAYLRFYKSKGWATVFLLYLLNNVLMDFAISLDVGLNQRQFIMNSLNINFSTFSCHKGLL